MMDILTVCRHAVFLFYLIHVLLSDLATGTRYLRKICKDSEIEILSSQGVRIEQYYRSHVELSLVDLQLGIQDPQSKFQVEFDFKTKSPNGVLFYSRSKARPSELLALVLSGGHLIYKIQCPTLHADILIPTRNMTRLDDGEWHSVSVSVKYRRFGNKGYITVDGYSGSKRYEVSCDRMSKLVMGGTMQDERGYLREVERNRGHFNGCIRSLKLYRALLSPPKYYAVSVCD